MSKKYRPIIIGAILFGIAMVVYSIHKNVEFFGDDDALCIISFGSWRHLISAKHPINTIALFVKSMNHLLFYETRHGNITSLYYCPLYFLFALLKLPFNYALFQFPVMLLVCVCVILFYALLRKNRVSEFYSIFATLILIFSPIFASAGRGIATHFLATVFFFNLFTIVALVNLEDTLSSKLFVAFALCQDILGNPLYVVTIPLILCAYFLSHYFKGTLKEAYMRVFHPVILIPATALFAMTIQTFLDAFTIAPEWAGNTKLGGLLMRGYDNTPPILMWGPRVLLENFIVLAGDLFPLLFLLSLFLFIKNRKVYRTNFTIVAFGFLTAALFCIFYVGVPIHPAVTAIYQGFMTPFLIGFTFLVVSQATCWQKGIKALSVLVLAFTVNAYVGIVYRKPVLFHDDFYKTHAYHAFNHGDTGVRALAYMTREIMQTTNDHIGGYVNTHPGPVMTFSGGYATDAIDIKEQDDLKNDDHVVRLVLFPKKHVIGSLHDFHSINIFANGRVLANVLIYPGLVKGTPFEKATSLDAKDLSSQFDKKYCRIKDFFGGPI